MAILVLGGTGFIGPRLIRKLVERGNDVVCMDINPGAAAFPGMEDQVRVMRGDVTQFEDVVHAISVAEPDRIINLAYLLGGGEINPHLNLRLNILGMDNCFEAARLLGVNRVVYASSIAVSGQQSNFGDRLVNEDDGMFGTSQYATHKIFNEFQAKMYIQNYGLSITGIRPANVTGPDKVRGSTDHVQCITLPARGEPVSFPHKAMMRLPIHVEDIAEVFARVLLVDSSHHPIYNSGGHVHQPGRPGRHGAGVPAGRGNRLRQRGRAGAVGQLPGGQQPTAGRIRDYLRPIPPKGAGDNQRCADRGGTAAGFGVDGRFPFVYSDFPSGYYIGVTDNINNAGSL